MRLLLDTHALLWWANNDPQLSQTAGAHIQKAGNRILVSAVSAWEIAIKFKTGRLPSAQNFVTDLPDYLRQQNFEPLHISVEHALRAALLSRTMPPRSDPFGVPGKPGFGLLGRDRMLIAQAIEEDVPILSVDQALDGYGANRIW